MAGDLVIEEGDLEVLRDRTRDLSGRLRPCPASGLPPTAEEM